MGALPPPATTTHWLPHDDFLLRKAAEAGASLQSLAKGAVQFSRRFTVPELQERWISLLYDPVVSEQASAAMAEFERSSPPPKLNMLDNDKDIKSVSGKRKTESVKSHYYSMRKRICSEAFPSMDMDFLAGPDDNNNNIIIINSNNNCEHQLPEYTYDVPLEDNFCGQEPGFDFDYDVLCALEMDQNKSIDDVCFADMPENVTATGLEAQVLNSPVSECAKPFQAFAASPPQMPDWNTIEDNSMPILPDFEPETINDFPFPVDGQGNEANPFAYGIVQSEFNMGDQIGCDNMGASTPSTDDLIAHLDSILNSTSDDDMFPMDTNGNEMINESLLDSYGSLLLDSPNAGQMANESLPLASVAPEESADKSHQHHFAEFQMFSSALSVNPACPELRNGVICCTLNTEDPEIPNNDDVFLPIQMPSTSLPSMKHWRYDESFHVMPRNGFNSQSNQSAWPVMKKREHSNLEQSRVSSQKVELGQHPRMGLNRSVGDCGKIRNTSSTEGPKLVTSPRTTTICALGVPGKETTTQSDQKKNLNCNQNQQLQQKNSVTIKQEQVLADTLQKNEPLSAEMVPELSAGDLQLDEDDFFDDSNEEIPYFSDVEALILDMDLSPDNKDISSNRGVAKYQHQQTKRTIMRLEQTADAHMQRVLAAKGALAVLYSRHLNYFIRKPEVLLGRGTAETRVDIDLSRECNGNKVSRRQAIIKINASGAFVLQNVSQHLICVNGKEIEPCHSALLPSNSLIEVRGMAFIFEMNKARVKQLVDGMRRGTEHKEIKD